MSQRTKYIDLTRTYLPIDPLTLPETMHSTEGEDRPEPRMPVVPYEGWNFMPTAYGWRSYFGLNSKLDIDALANPAKCRDSFVFQKNTLSNVLIALCDTGIWIKTGETTGAWTQAIALADPADGTVHEWSYCIIENELYVYRQGEASVWQYGASNGYVFTAHVPTTLTMAGQLGIFKAGGRLGYWDSADAVAHSGFDDKFDVTPSIETGANISDIVPLLGRIVTVLQHGEGFIIYGTKSIVAVRKNLNNTFMWEATAVFMAGIAYRRQACYAEPDTIHFAWTSVGLVKIENFQVEIIATELYDYLKESQEPVYLKFLQGRYLAVQIADANYVDGFVDFYTHTIPDETVTIAEAKSYIDTIPDKTINTTFTDVTQGQNTFSTFSDWMPNANKYRDGSEFKDCGGTTDYGNYRNHYFVPLVKLADSTPAASLAALNSCNPLDLAWSVKTLTNNGVTRSIASTVIPSTVSVPIDNHITENSNKGFYDKVQAIWDRYEALTANWMIEFERRLSDLGISAGTTGINSATNVNAVNLPLKPVGLANAMRAQPWPSSTALVGTTANPTLYEVGAFPLSLKFYTDVWLSFESYGECYWVNPHPLTRTEYDVGAPSNDYIKYNGPYTVTLSNWTGSFFEPTYGVGIVNTIAKFAQFWNAQLAVMGAPYNTWNITAGGNISFATTADLQLFIIALHLREVYSGESIRQFNVVAGLGAVDGYKYVNKLGIQTGVDATYHDKITSTFHDNSPTDFSWDTQVSATTGLESRDKIEYTKTVTNYTDCDVSPGSMLFLNPPAPPISWSYPYEYYRYDSNCRKTTSPNSPAALTMDGTHTDTPEISFINDSCVIDAGAHDANPTPRLFTMGFTIPPRRYSFTLGDTTFTGRTGTVPAIRFTFPGSTFLMQTGTPTPYNQTWLGAFVYDTQIKRWGKMKASYVQLLDFSPLNSTAVKSIPYTQFGVQGALLNSSGELHLFDSQPTDSSLKFGKWGLFRHGYTTLELLRADFRQPCTGSMIVDSSIDGQSLESGLTKTYAYSAATQVSEGIGNAGRWHSFKFTGQFDLTYLEATGWTSSRR